MSQSKATTKGLVGKGPGKAKAKAKSPAAHKTAAPAGVETAETVRIIPAATRAELPGANLAKSALSEQVIAAAAAVEAGLQQGEPLHPQAVQAMLAALCRVYSAHIDAGDTYNAFSDRNPVTPTDVMVTASGLLKAANLAVFELGMWQSWTGR